MIVVTYYHPGEAVLIDTDNMVKPIQDALIDLVYQDDRWITHTYIRKISIEGSFRIRNYSLVLREALSRGVEFLHITVDQAPNSDSSEVIP